MTSRERLTALMSGSLPDRVPVICNLFELGARELGISIQEYYSRAENVAEGQLKLLDHYKYDQLWAQTYIAADAEILGSKKTIFVEDGPPNVGHLIIQNEKDIESLVVDDGVFETPVFLDLLRIVEILKREKGKDHPILASVLGSPSMPAILMGIEKWLDLLYTGDDQISDLLLQKCSDFCRKKIRYLFEAGVDMVVYINSLGSSTFVTLQQFESTTIQWIKRDLALNGPEGIMYFNGGGLINPFLESIMENTGLSAFYINPLDSIPFARKTLSGKALLAAPINDIPMMHQSETQIIDEVKRIMQEGSPDGGFLFGTLLMPYLVPESKIEVMIKAAHHYGSY